MSDYLDFEADLDDPSVVSALDNVSVWSAPFGQLLLEHVRMQPGLEVLDVGCGTGFPSIELAQRLGPASTVHGIDPWQSALDRARAKADALGVDNVVFHEGSAVELDFENERFDLIVSNVGVNNFEDPARCLTECARVMKPGGRIVITTNVMGHMKEFYREFRRVLYDLRLEDAMDRLKKQEGHRSNQAGIAALFGSAGLEVVKTVEKSFVMRFADGSALFRHHLIKIGFLPGWIDVVEQKDRERVFEKLENELNRIAEETGELRLTVPMLFVEGRIPLGK